MFGIPFAPLAAPSVKPFLKLALNVEARNFLAVQPESTLARMGRVSAPSPAQHTVHRQSKWTISKLRRPCGSRPTE